MKNIRVKLVVTTPATHADKVRQAIGEAGGGKVGNYTFCSFTTKGTGRFRPGKDANPAIGVVGRLEDVAEDRIEVTCSQTVIAEVIAAIRRVHPYEEPAIDVFALLDES